MSGSTWDIPENIKMSDKARIAIRASKNHHVWGILPTTQYLKKRSIAERLYRLARVLEFVKQLEDV